jgi:cytochrome c-type biogenesis protein CcmH
MLLWMIFAVMTAAGLTAVLWPLMRPPAGTVAGATHDVEVYRDQLKEIDRDLARGVLNAGDAESARREVSRRLLAADSTSSSRDGVDLAAGSGARLRRAAAIATIIAIPAVGLTVYLFSGSPGLEGRPLAQRFAGPVESRSMPELVARVEAHLRVNPDDTKGWRVLAPVYMRLGRFADAADGFRQVLRIEGRVPEILVDFGEALAMGEGGLVTAEARRAFAEAAALSTEVPKAHFYLGLAELQDGRKDEAVAIWRGMLAGAPADAPWRAAVEGQIAKATGEAGTAPVLSQDAMAAAGDMAPEERQRMIEGMVQGLAERLAADGGTIDEWLRLARAQSVLGRGEDATATLDRARAAFAGQTEPLARIDELAASLERR